MVFSLKIFNNQKTKGVPPIEHLTEKINEKPIPERGTRGRFVSKKNAAKTTPTISDKPKSAISLEPATSTFYGKPVRRFYHNKKWYFAIDDIISLAAADSLNQKINLGDSEKLDKTRKDISQEFTYKDSINDITLEAAEAQDLIEMMPYVRGLYPGPFVRWITETSQFPDPVKKIEVIPASDTAIPGQVHPSDTGNK